MQNWKIKYKKRKKNVSFCPFIHSFNWFSFVPLSTFEFFFLCSHHTECNGICKVLTARWTPLHFVNGCLFFVSFFSVSIILVFKNSFSIVFSPVLFTEFGNTWISTGCTFDSIIVWTAIIFIDTMLWSKTTNCTQYNEFKSDIVSGDSALLCSHWSRQVIHKIFVLISSF